MLFSFLRTERSTFPLTLALLAALIGLTGCSSSQVASTGQPDAGDLASRFIGTEARLPHHPDQLHAVSVVLQDERVVIESGESYESLLRAWSTRLEYPETPSPFQRPVSSFKGKSVEPGLKRKDSLAPFVPFATLWSRDVALAALGSSDAFSSLPAAEAQKRVEKLEEVFGELIRVDLYQFGRFAPLGDPLDANVALVDESKDRYEPVRTEYSQGFANVQGASTHYERVTYYFPRTQDGEDILGRTSSLRLAVTPELGGLERDFVWSWPSSGTNVAETHR